MQVIFKLYETVDHGHNTSFAINMASINISEILKLLSKRNGKCEPPEWGRFYILTPQAQPLPKNQSSRRE